MSFFILCKLLFFLFKLCIRLLKLFYIIRNGISCCVLLLIFSYLFGAFVKLIRLLSLFLHFGKLCLGIS